MLEIITYPNKVLEQPSIPIKDVTDLRIKNLINEMVKTMRAHNGLGLAAPQVGHSLQLFIAEVDNQLLTFINPEIQKLSGKEVKMEEGCLSFPGKYIDITRPNKVKIKFTDSSGQKQILKTSGLLARVIQHEFDHLRGILFTEREKEKMISIKQNFL